MRPLNRLTAACLAVGIALGVTGMAHARIDDADATSQETTRKIRKALERLPYYGVFDFLAFGVEPGVVTLKGYAHRPALKHEVEDAVRRATKREIANQVEILPTSSYDDRIRYAAYQQIYDAEFADRYVSGGAMRAMYELLDMVRFPGMEPYGTYPVHIIVRNRHLTLVGVVVNESDKTQIMIRARQVPNTTGVDDAVAVRSR
jgi:hyperosmotically inducible periplasmic protein